MLQEIELFLIMLIFLEIFELFWQKGSHIQDYIKNLFYFYKKSLFLFIILHPSLYFVIFAQLYFQNYSFVASLLTIIKLFDVSIKITIMDKIYKKKSLGALVEVLRDNPKISPLLKASSLIIYPTLFVLGYMYSWQKSCFIIKFHFTTT